MKIGFVVPTHNNPVMLRNMLTIARNSGNWPDEVVVVSDASEKAVEEERVASEFGAKPILMNERSGFAKCVNAGCRANRCDILVLVNTDIIFLEPVLAKIKENFESDTKLSVLGAKLYSSDGRIQHGGGYYTWTDGVHYDFYSDEDKANMANRVHYPAYVTGAFMSFRRETWIEFGFNERYVFGCEDADLCANVWKTGWKVKYDPDIKLIHAEGNSRKDDWVNIAWKESKALFASQIVDWESDGTFVKIFNGMAKASCADKKVIVTRKGMTGDVVVFTKAIHALKMAYPELKIYVKTDYPEVFKGNPCVEGAHKAIASPDARIVRINTANGIRPTLRMDKTHIENIRDYGFEKIDGFEGPPELYPDDSDIDKAKSFGLGGLDYVILHQPITNWRCKTLPELTWHKVQAGIKNFGLIPVIVGGPKDIGPLVEGCVDIRGKDTIHVLKILIEGAKAFVGVDSGPFHVCQTTNTPGIVVFTCYPPELLVLSGNIIPVQAKDSCINCFPKQKAPVNWIDCPFNRNYECARNVDAKEILEKLEEVIENSSNG
jgi:ADP-heptose:LPS heptosyltransferase/GT2 family glycosyltransferase